MWRRLFVLRFKVDLLFVAVAIAFLIIFRNFSRF